MSAFRTLLVTIVIVMLVYTAAVVAAHGPNFLPIYVRDILALGWPGQFNVDFLMMLLLAATWIGWRERFSARGLLLAALTFPLGAAWVCVYLLMLSARAKGDVREVLVGREPPHTA